MSDDFQAGVDYWYYTRYNGGVAFEVSNEPDANPTNLSDDQIWLAIMDGRIHRIPDGPSFHGYQAYKAWGYTFEPANPSHLWALLVFVVYAESPGGDWFVRYARRATPEEESLYG